MSLCDNIFHAVTVCSTADGELCATNEHQASQWLLLLSTFKALNDVYVPLRNYSLTQLSIKSNPISDM